MKEELREVVGFPGYWVNRIGQVFSCKRKKMKLLNPIQINRGYLMVRLYKDDKMYARSIHRLVAEAFIPNPLGLDEVNHRNEDKLDNRVENLEWCTHKENINYGTRNERVAKSLRGKKKSAEAVAKRSKPVTAYRDGKLYGEYPSGKEAARQLGLLQGSISLCCNGKLKHTGGYEFRYKGGE